MINTFNVKRQIHSVFIHCTATDNEEYNNLKSIRQDHKKRGFDDIGYNYLITKDGILYEGRNINKTPAAQLGHNTGSIAICVCGLKDFTQDSFITLKDLCNEINKSFKKKNIILKFRGHCEVSAKECPVFDYKKILNLNKKGYLQDSKITDIKTNDLYLYCKEFLQDLRYFFHDN